LGTLKQGGTFIDAKSAYDTKTLRDAGLINRYLYIFLSAHYTSKHNRVRGTRPA